MRIETIKRELYQFDELSKEAKQSAIESLSDLNVNDNWWDFTYEDAESIGLKLTGFDLDRSNYCNGTLTLSSNEICANIFRDHGTKCDTYQTAMAFMDEYNPIFADYMDESSPNYENSDLEEKMQDLESDFLHDLLEDYLSILRHEYKYLTSESAIIEAIEANEYEFTVDGQLA